MAHNEAARQTAEPIVIADSPDVCLTPMGSSVVPVPYPIVAYFNDTVGTTTTVAFTQDPVFTTVSDIVGVEGDEAGTLLGVASGSHAGGSYCHVIPMAHTPVVKTEGNLIVYHSSKMGMNCPAPQGPYNTIGTVIWQQTSGTTSADENGEVDGETNPAATPETADEVAASAPESGPDRSWKTNASAGGGYNHADNASAPTSVATDPSGDGFSSKVGVSTGRTTADTSFQPLGEDTNFHLNRNTTTQQLGYDFDPRTGTHSVGGKLSHTYSAADVGTGFGDPEGLLRGNVRAQVATATANGEALLSTGPGQASAKVAAALEVDAVKVTGNLGGTIGPKSIYDYFGSRWANYRGHEFEPAPESWNWGVVVEAEGEAGLGAGIAGEAGGEYKDGRATLSLGGKAGLGPKLGGKVTLGIQTPDGLIDGAWQGVKDWLNKPIPRPVSNFRGGPLAGN
ncbi:MAG: DUF4150 domain-containing protein [Sandaracinaceae bacterium]